MWGALWGPAWGSIYYPPGPTNFVIPRGLLSGALGWSCPGFRAVFVRELPAFHIQQHYGVTSYMLLMFYSRECFLATLYNESDVVDAIAKAPGSWEPGLSFTCPLLEPIQINRDCRRCYRNNSSTPAIPSVLPKSNFGLDEPAKPAFARLFASLDNRTAQVLRACPA